MDYDSVTHLLRIFADFPHKMVYTGWLLYAILKEQ